MSTKNIKLKDFLQNTSVPASLARAIVRKFGGWDEAQTELVNVANSPCGMAGGFGGFVYYTETTAFFNKNRKAILELATEFDSQCDNAGLIGFVAGFNTFKNSDITHDDIAKAIYAGRGYYVENVKNALAWFACEQLAFDYANYIYELENQ